jgi:hypothetical protein
MILIDGEHVSAISIQIIAMQYLLTYDFLFNQVNCSTTHRFRLAFSR